MQKTLPLLFCLLTVFTFSGKAQCVYVTQPGPSEGIDAVCHRYPVCNLKFVPCDTSNQKNTKHIYASAKQLGGVKRTMRSFVKFDLSQFGALDQTALPNSATLDLYYFRNAQSGDEHLNPGNNSFYIERIVKPWKDDTIRWMFPASSFNLRMPEVAEDTTISKNRILVPATTSSTSDVSVDMSEMVSFWLEYPDSNFGFRIALVDETIERQVHFCSSDYDDAQYRPKLTIDFPLVIGNAGADTIACQGTSIRLDASGGAEYTWSATTSGQDILSKYDIYNPFLNATKAQTFEVEVKTGSCTAKDQVFIDFGIPRPAKITIPSGNDTAICLGESLQLEAAGGTFFNWLPANILSQDNVSSPVCTPTESTMIYVETFSSGDLCPGKDSVYIDLLQITDGQVGFNDTTICLGDSIKLNASGGLFYKWTPSDSVNVDDIENPVAYVRDTTMFVVETEGLNACPDYDTVYVNVVKSVSVDAGPDITICEGESTQLNASGSGVFDWDNEETLDDPFSATPIATPAVTTTYTLKLTANGSCSGEDMVTITVNPAPIIQTTSSDTTICVETNSTLSVSGTDNYWWNTGESGDKIIVNLEEPNKTFIYKVVGNDGTCESDTLYINVNTQRCGEPYVIAPKFFSPNGDGINDRFVVKDIKRYDNELIIINKWGDVVFRRDNYDNTWDGTYNGQNVAEDTYLYVIRVNIESEWVESKGTVTILRSRN
ncbi:MAG: gliding motility-associated C-terminal domain-containing protein [Bacteroidia bacterium]